MVRFVKQTQSDPLCCYSAGGPVGRMGETGRDSLSRRTVCQLSHQHVLAAQWGPTQTSFYQPNRRRECEHEVKVNECITVYVVLHVCVCCVKDDLVLIPNMPSVHSSPHSWLVGTASEKGSILSNLTVSISMQQ